MWYPRHMLQTRMAMFWGGATLAGAFSGLLAFVISFMAGTAGLEGWAWIFVSSHPSHVNQWGMLMDAGHGRSSRGWRRSSLASWRSSVSPGVYSRQEADLSCVLHSYSARRLPGHSKIPDARRACVRNTPEKHVPRSDTVVARVKTADADPQNTTAHLWEKTSGSMCGTSGRRSPTGRCGSSA